MINVKRANRNILKIAIVALSAFTFETFSSNKAEAGQICAELLPGFSLCFNDRDNSTPTPASRTVGQPRLINGNYAYSGPFGPGYFRHFATENGASSDAYTRVCLVNRTGQPKSLQVNAPGVGLMYTPTNGSKHCATMPSNLRINMIFADRGKVVKNDNMTLSAYAGDIVTFSWTKD